MKYKHEDIVEALRLLHEGNTSEVPINQATEFDLGIRKGKTEELLAIYEVKPRGDSQSIYTGVGQLLCYVESQPKAKRILVAPSDTTEYLVRRVKNQGLTFWGFSVRNGKYTFKKL